VAAEHDPLPFVLGMAIAYSLDPVVERMERWGLSRSIAAAVIIVGSSSSTLPLVLPTVIEQVVGLVRVAGVLLGAVRSGRALPSALSIDLRESPSPRRRSPRCAHGRAVDLPERRL
jgi:hypothetical protein